MARSLFVHLFNILMQQPLLHTHTTVHTLTKLAIVRIQLPTMQPPNEFLSGESDPKVGSILRVGSLQIDSRDNAAPSSNQSNAKIQIVESMESSSLPPPPRGSSSNDSFSDDESEPPPSLYANRTIESSTSTRNQQANDSGNNNNNNSINQEESLMEQMMKEALKAKKENDEKKNTSIRKNAKQSFGLKKGFLNASSSSSSSSSSKTKSKQTKENHLKLKLKSKSKPDWEPVYELDSEGNMIPIIPKSTVTSTQKKTNPLHLDEVQESMKASSDTFASNWSTSPDLLQRISSDPILFKDMTNPKYTAALEALQQDPKEAMKRFENHPDVKDFLNRMCRVLGDHFTELGEKQDQEQKQVKEQGKKKQGRSNDVKEKDVGPLAYSALQKEKMRQEHGKESFDKMSKKEKDQVDAIMKDQELTRILMDVDMQRVMQECSTIPGKMKMYMSHDVHGAKLRKLIQAGLLRMA